MGIGLGRVPWMGCDGVTEPNPDRGHVYRASVDEVAFVVTGAHRAGGAELVDRPLDNVAILVRLAVERRRPATSAAALSGGDLIGLLRDRCPDPSATQVGAVAARGVSLVGRHGVGSTPRSAPTRPRDVYLLQHHLEHDRVMPLPRGRQRRDRPAPGISGQVDLGAEPTARATQRLTVEEFVLLSLRIRVIRPSPL
jgi:hypothetical protein